MSSEQPRAGTHAGGAARPSFRTLTPRQRGILLLVLLGLPVLALLLAEGGLRLAGYGSSFPLFVEVEAAPDYRTTNPAVGLRYFRRKAGTPVPMPEMFRAEKHRDGYRVFVQGASTAAGFPYGNGGAFGRMLEQRLQETFPDREIEVVTVALDATNSYTLRDLAPQIIEASPDAVLIYAGHNEYYGALGVASAESIGRSPGVVRSYLWLRKLRTVQWWQNTMEWAAGVLWKVIDRPTPPRRTLMEYLASEHTVVHDSPLYHAGIDQFERNMDALFELYQEAGVPVFIGTLASNERHQPPLLSRPAAPSTDTTSYSLMMKRAEEALRNDDRGTAGATLDSLIRLDHTAADPFFLRGRLFDSGGSAAEARDDYIAARDRDQLPFRAPSSMNRSIRETAARRGARVVETLQALRDASPGGVVDSTLMLEHLHPNVTGQFLLADAFYRALQEAGEIGEWSGAVPAAVALARVPVTAVDSLAARLMVSHLTSRFPFQPAGTRAITMADTLRPDNRIEQIALARHRQGMPWLSAMAELGEHYGLSGQWEEVAHVNRVVAQEVAYAPEPLLTAAQASLLAGDDDAARRDAEAAQRRLATAQGAWLLGNVLARRGDMEAARVEYQRALSLNRRHRRSAASLAALESIPALEQAAREAPSDADANAELAAAYFMTGRYEEAEQLADRVLAADPEHAMASQVMRQLQAIYRRGSE